jgi:cell division protein FtsB
VPTYNFTTFSGSITFDTTEYSDEVAAKLREVDQQRDEANRAEGAAYSASREVLNERIRNLQNQLSELDRVHTRNSDRIHEAFREARQSILTAGASEDSDN